MEELELMNQLYESISKWHNLRENSDCNLCTSFFELRNELEIRSHINKILDNGSENIQP